MDAYGLTSVTCRFEVVFAADWYSHIPMSKLPVSWQGLANITPDQASIILIDMTCKKSLRKQMIGYDSDGNCLSSCTLPDGSTYRIIKDFPTADDIDAAARPYFERIGYRELSDVERWLWIGRRNAHDPAR